MERLSLSILDTASQWIWIWFGDDPIAQPTALIDHVQELVDHPFVVSSSSKGTVVGQIEGVKVSFFNLPFRLLGPLQEWSGCRLASFEDLSAMKLLAVAQRGTRRDFVDVQALFRGYAPLRTLIDHFVAKYPDGSVPHLLRSLTYFKDADGEPSPKMLTRSNWEQVKRDIVAEVAALEGQSPHIGSSFDSFLEEHAIRKEVESIAKKKTKPRSRRRR